MKKRNYVAAIFALILIISYASTMTSSTKAYFYGSDHSSNLYTTNWLQVNDSSEVTYTALSQIADL